MSAHQSRRLTVLAALGVVLGGGIVISAPAAGAAAAARTVTVQVVPRIAGVHFTVEGVPGTTDVNGTATVPVPDLAGAAQGLVLNPQNVSLFKRVKIDHAISNPNHGAFQRDLVAELDVQQLVSIKLITPENVVFPITGSTSVTLESSLGSTKTYNASDLSQAMWLPGSTPAPTRSGVGVHTVTYAVKSVVIRGANVVNSGQNHYSTNTLIWQIPLLMHALTVEGNDLLAGAPAGSSVQLTYPDQSKVTVGFSGGHQVVIPDLPRGTYKIKVNGGVIPLGSTVRLSKDQTATEIVVTAGDVGELLAVLIIVVGVLVAAGVIGRRLRRRAGTAGDTRRNDDGDGGGGTGAGPERVTAPGDEADGTGDPAGGVATPEDAEESSDATLV